MAIVPIEIIKIGNNLTDDLKSAIALANSVQKEFLFIEVSDSQSADLQMYAYDNVSAAECLDALENFRKTVRGYHPFVMGITDSFLDGGELTNLFGRHRGEKGVAIITTSNVPDIIVPKDRMIAYYLYYISRYTLSFLSPTHKSHDATRGCVFDHKINKLDLLDSMRARALCDECRKKLITEPGIMSPHQFAALDSIFELAGNILQNGIERDGRPRAFIGSSVEGLNIANKMQELLVHDISSVIWNQGTIFGLGDSTLEALEAAVLEYQFGIFIFSPDDQLQMRGEIKPVARDNVLFELGLFLGKLGRHRAFVVNPGKKAISLPSDLHGITTAIFDPNEKNLVSALGPVCNQIREAVKIAQQKNFK